MTLNDFRRMPSFTTVKRTLKIERLSCTILEYISSENQIYTNSKRIGLARKCSFLDFQESTN